MKTKIISIILTACLLLGMLPALNVFADEPIWMWDCAIVGPDGMTYTGKELKPKITVKYNGNTLKEGTDYEVTLEGNNPGTPGSYALAWIRGIEPKYTSEDVWPFLVLFKDVPLDHNFQEHVYWATYAGVAAGYSGDNKGKFGVSDKITRGQLIMMIWRYAGEPKPKNTTKQTFKDVPISNNFFKAIQWANENGIAGGYTGSKDGYFGPGDPCTRGQIATFIWKYKGRPEPIGKKQKFTDVPVNHNFYKAIQWAYENGITAGFSDNSFGVSKDTTRGQCVTFLHRMYLRFDEVN